MKDLEYPFNPEFILRNKKKIKKMLIQEKQQLIIKKIALLGGSSTHDIMTVLELFLLNHKIKSEFYESEYNKYWEDACFGNPILDTFLPDLVFIHTNNRNIYDYPEINDTEEEIENKLNKVYLHYEIMWDKLIDKFHCTIIQNNFEYPFYRIMGNKEAVDIHGKISFINRLNELFYKYAREHDNFFIHDINYLSASYGLEQWAEPFYWHMYKYSLNINAIPLYAHSVANIIKSIYGKNKKALVLDLDNTLWGGIVGDDGVENLEIGNETSVGQVYTEFQKYLNELKATGIMLNINSKNDYENGIAGINHPESILKEDDFIIKKINWKPKSLNIMEISEELNILPESLVFIDDNPAEREIVSSLNAEISTPNIGDPEKYIQVIDKSGFFEITNLSMDDLERNKMYKENQQRMQFERDSSFNDYSEYLISLEMRAVIKSFDKIYLSRIFQLTNKSNQFNLTTKRYTQAEIGQVYDSDNHINIYGKLEDKFGDNGVVSVIIGSLKEQTCHIDLWIMSCRVLKRNMEEAMMDALVKQCLKKDVSLLKGYYYPTAKNGMVKNHYETLGFKKVNETTDGSTEWELEVSVNYKDKNNVIKVVN